MTVVEHPAQAPRPPDGYWAVATWADVAAQAVTVLRDRLGVDWRRSAWAPQAPAGLLVLAELLEYLDQEHQIVSDPLTTTDLVAFANAAQAGSTLEALLSRVAQLSGEPLSGGVGWEDDGSAAWVVLDARDEDWWAIYDGCPEIHLADADTYFGAHRRGEPAIGLGLDLPAGYGETVLSTHVGWVEQLRAAGLDPYPDEAWLRFYRTVYLVEVLVAGVTLEEQARFVADRLRQTLTDLRGMPPAQPLELPAKRGPRRRAAAPEADGPGGESSTADDA